MKEPAVGPDIIDLSILPPFTVFFLLVVALGVADGATSAIESP